MILLSRDTILCCTKVSPVVIDYAHRVLTVIAFSMWVRVSNLILFIGIFRAGGRRASPSSSMPGRFGWLACR